MATLCGAAGPEVVPVPAGLLARGRFSWRHGDRLVVISSSGELRDAVEAIDAGVPRPFAAITAHPESSIGRNASAIAKVRVLGQEAITHTQAYCGNVAAALAVWAEVTHDDGLRVALRRSPDATQAALGAAGEWASAAGESVPRPRAAATVGSGPAWSAALEAALLLKEVARVPAEGHETREGATSGMYALAGDDVVLVLATGRDPLVEEAEEVWAATGASVLRAPGGDFADARLAPLTTFPAALALAVELGLSLGHDVDRPGWADAYYATARVHQETEVS
jgi:glucosamine--fructose-6-phosphate aminotransferase (isomerizing)